jgi:hypothetical protein
MPDCQIPKQLLYGELVNGKRSQVNQKDCYKNSLKLSLKTLQKELTSLEKQQFTEIEVQHATQSRNPYRREINY